ncbi:MAG: DNA repair and recombination protein RadB [Methanotrichaceae archaeon]|nr:DNA repair and recombination protein RadB [Methanotrichaceae archaeon]
MTALDRLPSGCKALDRLLGGGFESGVINQIYGEAGTGKTNIAMQLCIQAVNRGFRVVYIDAEGFSPDRFKQIAGERAKEIAAKILIFEPLTLHQQHLSIKEAAKIARIDLGLIVLDSATVFYRVMLEVEDNKQVRKNLLTQMGTLLEIARRHRVPALITNQVYTDIDTGTTKPLGGTALMHMCKTIFELEKIGNGWRRARIIKHRSQPEGETTEFKITEKGLE